MKIIKKRIKYEDIHDIVEYLVKTKSYPYAFGCWTPDDIAQEIRLICFQKIKHFDPTRVEEDRWKNFFGRCVDNALKNLKRDNYLRTSPPVRVDIDGMTPSEVLEFKKTEDYARWKRFQSNLQRKLKILHPIPIDALGDTIKHNRLEAELEYKDLEKHVVDSIAPELKEPLRNMLDGKGKTVSKKDKRKVQAFIKKFLV
jgi:hypothetical protein